MFSKCVTSWKRTKTDTSVLQSETLNLLLQNNCVFFLFTFWPVQFKYSVHPCINKTLLFNSFFKISIYLLLPFKWSVHCYLCPSPRHPISLFSVTCFELQITRTSFDFPWRFELSGVDCTGPCEPSSLDCSHANNLPVRRAAKFPAKLKEFWLKQTPAIRTRYYGLEGTSFGPDSTILLLDYSLWTRTSNIFQNLGNHSR